jgi:predicted peptidase
MCAQDAITLQPADPLKVFEARVFENTQGSLQYRLLKPLGHDPKQKYPLVLFLHGAGERGDDNRKQLLHGGRNFAHEAMRRRHPAVVVFPQCSADKRWVEVAWDGEHHTASKASKAPSVTMHAVLALVDALREEFPIDERRIYGVGLSMGGFGIWDILQRKPTLLAAAISICGGGDPSMAARFKSTPVWAFHGEIDPAVSIKRTREMVEAIADAGGRPIYTEYEGVGHDSWTHTFENRVVWDWLFAQKQ